MGGGEDTPVPVSYVISPVSCHTVFQVLGMTYDERDISTWRRRPRQLTTGSSTGFLAQELYSTDESRIQKYLRSTQHDVDLAIVRQDGILTVINVT